MKYLLFLLILLCLFGCENETEPITTYYSDNQYHDTDLRISKGENLLAEGSPLTTYEKEQGLFLQSLHDMAIDPETKDLYLIESENDHIIKLSSSGEPLFKIRAEGRGPGEFIWPHTIKVRNEQIYIFDKSQSKISIYSSDGIFIKDIVPQGVPFNAFEVTSDGNIIIPNLYPLRFGGTLFLLFNEKGRIVGQFGNNNIVQDAFKESGMMSSVELFLSNEGQLVLSFYIPGSFFVYNLPQRKLSHSFSIQRGQEWRGSFEREKDMKGYPVRIRDVCITSEGDMLVGWGGPFKDEISIGMQFSSKGEFIGRIFSSEQLAYVPSHMVLENDSTLWVHNLTTYQLFRTHLRPAHREASRTDAKKLNKEK